MGFEIIFQNTDVINNKTSFHRYSSHGLMIKLFGGSKCLKYLFHFNSKTWPRLKTKKNWKTLDRLICEKVITKI